jgi:hypothetical protein
MLLFIDESGDLGMKLGQGSTTYFALGAVLFAGPKEAAECGSRIEGLKKQLASEGGSGGGTLEFHFAKNDDRIRERFLMEISAHSFTYFISYNDKRRLSPRQWRDRTVLWKSAATVLVGLVQPHILDAVAHIDKSSDRRFNQEAAKHLKNEAGHLNGQPRIREVKAIAAENHPLIQLADMVCGAVARFYKDATAKNRRFRKLIRAREGVVRSWP